MSDGEFAGKVAVVTGGSTGIGKAVVTRLAGAGAAVVFCSNDAPTVDSTTAEFKRAGMPVNGHTANVAVAGDMQRLMAAAVSAHGGIDLLAACHGVQTYGTVVDTDEATWDRTLGVNLKGNYLASKYAVPESAKRGGGAIVHISLVQGQACQTDVAAYAASKGGLNALTRAMALDHAKDKIRVNAICPGSVDTPMLRHSANKFKGDKTVDETVLAWARAHPMGRALGRSCTAEEVAELVAFLLSERAAYISGAEHRIDGALLAGLGIALPE